VGPTKPSCDCVKGSKQTRDETGSSLSEVESPPPIGWMPESPTNRPGQPPARRKGPGHLAGGHSRLPGTSALPPQAAVPGRGLRLNTVSQVSYQEPSWCSCSLAVKPSSKQLQRGFALGARIPCRPLQAGRQAGIQPARRQAVEAGSRSPAAEQTPFRTG